MSIHQVINLYYIVQVPKFDRETKSYVWSKRTERLCWANKVTPEEIQKCNDYAKKRVGTYWSSVGHDELDLVLECYSKVEEAAL